MPELIFLDTETGGLYSRESPRALLQIGAVHVDITEGKLRPLAQFAVKLRPHPETAVLAASFRANGLTWKDLDDPERVDECEALTQLGEWLAVQNRLRLPFWAHEASFDRAVVTDAIFRSTPRNSVLAPLVGRDARWNCSRYYAEALVEEGLMPLPAGGMVEGREIKSGVSLDALLMHFGLPHRTGGHDALGDAKLGARILAKLKGLKAGSVREVGGTQQ